MAITTTRRCSACLADLSFDSFHITKNGRDGLHSRCKPCRSDDAKRRSTLPEYKEKNRLAQIKHRKNKSIYRQKSYVRFRFNCEPEVIISFVAKHIHEHGPRCLSCGVECDIVGGVKRKGFRRLVVDHCHETGRLRGMLCDLCNTALGKLGDNIEGVKRLLSYIEATS